MKDRIFLNVIFFCLGLFSCSNKFNPVFREMLPSTEYIFISDTLYNNLVIKKENCIVEIDNREVMINDRTYYRISICTGGDRSYKAFVRRDSSKIYINHEINERYGFGEQILFDVNAKVGECWNVAAYDKMEVCIGRKYFYHNVDTVVVHHIKHIGNVSDYPRILEYRVGSKVGIVSMKFSDGDYSILK